MTAALSLDHKTLKRRYKQLGNCRSLASELGVSVTSVTKYLKLAGIEIPSNTDRQRKGRYSESVLRKCHRKYLKGQSIDAIALELNLGAITLAKEFKARGWTRSQGDWIREFYSGESSSARKGKLKLLQNEGVRPFSADGFRSSVAYISNQVARRYNLQRKSGWSLDHKYSLWAAYYNVDNLDKPVTIQELCHPVNLEVIRSVDNSSKNRRCSITVSELRRQIRIWNSKNGCPFKEEPFSTYDFTRWNV